LTTKHNFIPFFLFDFAWCANSEPFFSTNFEYIITTSSTTKMVK
jgi:hypothetical protein